MRWTALLLPCGMIAGLELEERLRMLEAFKRHVAEVERAQ
jgi:hypothetical protein